MDEQIIALADRFFPLVKSGKKTSTIRYKRRNYALGACRFYSDTSDLTADIYILSVEYKRFCDLTEQDAKSDGFESLETLKNELLGFYPTAKPVDEITKVTFVCYDYLGSEKEQSNAQP